ncbi:putative enzyme related to lactoylglutathione lyase [Povalibacter uvarum]|uniref:Putative enzyme related to lactoylglutathione lyase n=1 Tax=Povalibacter uvarum TaxID=732238 RepID=A0A841HGQ6_9GAMM|nr:VOC family protein [Povalibacter uvarum]MBB6091754.1 putative enzyme related to lactoylglutathione lyase [Povalibacter uvarum]
MKRFSARLHASCLLACALLGSAVATAEEPQPAAPSAQFHHVHLNSIDPATAVDFYTTKFKARKEKFAGLGDAVWTGDSWLLFSKVSAPPPSELISSIWHIGWGAEDMQTTYQKQVDSGTKFATPITDITAMTGGSRPFYYAYVAGPDGALIELNTANHHNFGHVHMFSADAPAAGAWYARNFGWRIFAQSQKREFRGIQIAPAAFVTAGHVSMIIYPIEYVRAAAPDAWKGREGFVTTRGRVVDHLGFSVADLDATLDRLRKNGVKITAEPVSIADGQLRFAFIEGPDQVAIELIEDRSTRPAKIEE